MKPVCEIIVLEVLPAVRAIVAKMLLESYGLTQKQTADALGVSQPAVSQYRKGVRGYGAGLLKTNKKFIEIVNSLAKKVASGQLTPIQQTPEFCEICRVLRNSGIACKLHRENDPSLGNCSVCFDRT